MEDKFMTYLKSGFPLIAVNTVEVTRAVKDLTDMVNKWNKGGLKDTNAPDHLKNDGYSIIKWDANIGWGEQAGKTSDPGAASIALKYPLAKNSPSGIYILQNFHLKWSDPLDYPAIAQDVLDIAGRRIPHRHVVIVGPLPNIPTEISHMFAWIDYELPSRDDIKKIMGKFKDILATKPTKQMENQIADAASGMTMYEAEQAIKASIVKEKGKKVNVESLFTMKAKTVRKSGLFDYMEVDETIKSVGGLVNLKSDVAKTAKVFKNREKADKYGLPVPRGILLTGLSGCGKSLVAKVIAHEFILPLYLWDMGKLFGGIVGDTERNTREAFKLINSLSPAVFFIDEMEKNIGGAKSSSMVDAGITEKVVGAFLTFMQEKTCPAFFVATANSVDNLAPEVLRRFNSIWFVDLPTAEERKEIFIIHLNKKGRDPKKFAVDDLVKLTDRFTGAEIQAVIEDAMFTAFFEDREFTTKDVKAAIANTPVMVDTKDKDITRLRMWAKGRARIANVKPEEKPEWWSTVEKDQESLILDEKKEGKNAK